MSLTKDQLFNTVEQIKEYVDYNDNKTAPHIDETTKHWFIGEVDTGVSAEGKDGTGADIIVDSAMSSTSTNPVQNKVVKEYVDNKSVNVSTEDGNAIVKNSDGLYVKDLEPKIDQLNIAQKTVNETGSKSLLSSPVSFTCNLAPTIGTGARTIINKTITLTDDITNYDYIDIYLGMNSSSVKLHPQVTRVKVDNIAYNNSTTQNLTNGSYIVLKFITDTVGTGAYGGNHGIAVGWFKDAKNIFIYSFLIAETASEWKNWQIIDIVGIKDKAVMIDPVEYIDSSNGIEDTPVGHIIPYMGNVAPSHYLICDGSTYNIADYPYLVQHFKDEFGSANYFGGNGITTFAVPDLRGEFLRGTGTNSHTNQGSGSNVGIHQDATEHINIGINTSVKSVWTDTSSPRSGTTQIGTAKQDTILKLTTGTNTSGFEGLLNTWSGATNDSHYTSRPTNTSVLYCIKYEPTYFMKNTFAGFCETVLFDGDAYTANGVYELLDSISNYDYLFVEVSSNHANADFTGSSSFMARTNNYIRVSDIQIIADETIMPILEQNVASVFCNSSWYYFLTYFFINDGNKFIISESYFEGFKTPRIKKIIGIKATSADSNNISYTDEEIQEAVANVLGGAN